MFVIVGWFFVYVLLLSLVSRLIVCFDVQYFDSIVVYYSFVVFDGGVQFSCVGG